MGESCIAWDKSLVVPNRAEDGGAQAGGTVRAAPPPSLCPKAPSRGSPQRLEPQLSLVLEVLRTWAHQALQKKTWTWSLH